MFTVPIIPPDLRHEETIIQAAHALNCLQNTINSVFDRIDKRIGTNNDKVQSLEQRIARAQTKIKGLVGTKKAIRIYSPARFPATHVFHDIPLTFEQISKMDVTEPQKQAPYEVKSRVETLPNNALEEKLLFFHVRTKETPGAQKSLAEAKKDVNQQKGMGTIPENLKSVNSLLLFNSEERVYAVDSEEDLNSWKRAKLFKNQRQSLKLPKAGAGGSEKQLIEPAPFSLSNKQHGRTRLQAQNGLFYTPRLNEAPEIDLPLDLPDLPGIADDIHFEGKDQQQIAPSLFIDNLPDLQELESTETTSIESTKQTLNVTATQQHSNTVNISSSAAPPPPPPPPLPPQIPTIAAPMAPPPPPPPPLLNSKTATKSNNLSSKNAVRNSSPQNDVRSDLMDAIRKAGGTRVLRAAADVVDKPVTQSMHSKPATGGDLMADLHNKLLMRRKGISGAKDSETKGAAAPSVASGIHSNPVINRLSSLIPPPPPVAQRARNSQITDDDDDADESNDADWTE